MRTHVARLVAILVVALTGWSHSQETTSLGDHLDQEEAQEKVIADRFLGLLKKRPRTGVTLEKVFSFHLTRGSLQQLIDELTYEGKKRNDGNCFATVGLLKMQLADDLGAVNSFLEAERLSGSDPMISYQLAQSLMRLGETEKALEAYSRAIQKKPGKADGLAVFQDYGKSLQRLGRDSDARMIWAELDQMFPGDMQVQERIAKLQYDEGAYTESLERYQKLASLSRDRLQSVEASMQAAEIKSLLGKHDEALADLELQISRVNPDSWLYRDGRRRIEDVFRRQGKTEQLIHYYVNWMTKHADDVDALQRCVSLLSNSGQYEQAEQLLTASLEKVPSNIEARRILIQLLVKQDKRSLATGEAKKLLEQQPDNADLLLQLGEIHFANRELELPERQQLALETWMKMLAGHEKDPARTAQVAELISRLEMPEKAISIYQRAIELQPEEAKYREYLGEYLYKLGRKQEAENVWEDIASESRATYENLIRLSEVYQTFDLMDEAVAAMKRACETKSRFESHARLGHLLSLQLKYDEAMVQWQLAEELADDSEQRTQALNAKVEILAANGQLVKKLAEAKQTTNEKPSDAASWRWLSKLYQASGNRELAYEAILHASSNQPTDLVIAREAAALVEAAGKWSEATAIYERLVKLDSQNKGKHLRNLVNLRARLGDFDGAIQAGKTLVALAPNNAEYRYQLANLYADAGNVDASRAELRQAVRRNPKDITSLLRLAASLAESAQSAEAIELYWRALGFSTSIDQQQPILAELSHLYYRSNRIEVLVERLRTLAVERNNPRDGLVWSAIVFRAAYDYGNARAVLEKLAADFGSDPIVIEQLVTASRFEEDWDAAIAYQRKLCDLAPSKSQNIRLIRMLLESEKLEEAIDYLHSHEIDESDVESILGLSDDLCEKERWDLSGKILDAALSKLPGDWEMSIVTALVNLKLGNKDRAYALACEVLDNKLSPAEPSRWISRLLSGNSRHAKWIKHDLAMLSRPMEHVNDWQSMFDANSFSLFSDRRAARYGYGHRATQYENPSRTIECLSDARMAAFQVVRTCQQQGVVDASRSLDSRLAQLEASGTAQALWETMALRSYGVATESAINRNPAVNALIDRLAQQGDERAVDLKIERILKPIREASKDQKLDATTRQIVVQQAHDLVREAIIRGGSYADSIRCLLKPLAGENRYEQVIQLVDHFAASKDVEAYQFASFAHPLLRLFPVPKEFDQTLWTSTERIVNRWLDGTDIDSNEAERINPNTMEQMWDNTQGLTIEKKLALCSLIIQWRISQHASYVDDLARNTQSSRVSYSAIGDFGNGSEVRLLFPPTCEYMSVDIAKTLHLVARTMTKDGELSALIELCARKSKEDASDHGKCIWLMSQASLNAWSGKFDQALKCVDDCKLIAPSFELAEMARAYIHVANGDLSAALQSIEKIRPTSNRMSIEREQAIVQLQLELGRFDSAKQTVQRLLGQQLNTETLMAMSKLARQLGMPTTAARSMSKLRSTAGGNIDSLIALMQRHAEDGEMESAVDLAREIIGRVGFAVQGTKKEALDTALETLQKANQLEAFVETQEQMLEKSPKSQPLMRYLMNCYELMGRSDDVSRLAKLLTDKHTQAQQVIEHGHRLQLYGDHASAAKKYLEAFALRPTFLRHERDHISQMLQSFDRVDGSWDQLVNIVLDADREKLAEFEARELFDELFQRRDFSAIDRWMIPNIAAGDWRALQECLDHYVQKGIVPSKGIGQALLSKHLLELPNLTLEDWERELDQDAYYGRNERLALQVVFQLAFPHQELADATIASLERIETEQPDNHAVRLAYVFALIQVNQVDRVVELLKPILDNPAFRNKVGLVKLVVEEISQKSPKAVAILELTNKLYASFPKLRESHLAMPFENTPLLALTKYFVAAGNQAAHREILMGRLNVLDWSVVAASEDQHEVNKYFDACIVSATSLLKLGYPLDALLAYQAAERVHFNTMRGKETEWSHDALGKSLVEAMKSVPLESILLDLISNSRQDALDDLSRQAFYKVFVWQSSERELKALAAVDSFLSFCASQKWSSQSPLEKIHHAVQEPPNEESPLCKLLVRLIIQCRLVPNTSVEVSKQAFMVRLEKDVSKWLASRQTQPVNENPSSEESNEDVEFSSLERHAKIFCTLAASDLTIWDEAERTKLLSYALQLMDPQDGEDLALMLMRKLADRTAQDIQLNLLKEMLDSVLPNKDRVAP